MSASPYMPLYIADYMADAAHLSTLEHGAYLLLIMNYWQKGKPLPADDLKLARIVGLRIQNWKKIKSTISEFFIVTDQEWQHSRIEKELAIFRGKSDKARLAGQKSGEKRREKLLTDVERPLNERSTTVERTLNHTDTDTDTDIYIYPPSEDIRKSFDLPSEEPEVETEKITPPKKPECPHTEIIALYHEALPDNPQVMKWTPTRKSHLQARWKEQPDLETWRKFFKYVSKSDFLTGKINSPGRRPFLASLDWLIKQENHTKILEGKYHEY